MNDYDTPEIRCSLRNLSRVTEWRSHWSSFPMQSTWNQTRHCLQTKLRDISTMLSIEEAVFTGNNVLILGAAGTGKIL